ncbi:hypothetical protein Tco_1096636 [Tanacetum coccineum]
MQEVILFYNGLGIPTRQILDSRAIQAQLKNLGREIKKVNEKVYVAQVRCEQCKRPYYTKYCPLKEEGKTLEETYYMQFGGPFQGGGYRAAAPGFYQRNNSNPSYQERRQSMEDTLSKFMSESAKRHKENSNLIIEIPLDECCHLEVSFQSNYLFTAEVGEAQLTEPEIIHETTEKIFKIRDRMQWCVIDKRATLTRGVGPLNLKLEKRKDWDPVLPIGIAPGSLVSGHCVPQPIEIMDREVKQLKQSRIPIVKVRWNELRGPEYMWEREDQFKSKYPHLFANSQSFTTS